MAFESWATGDFDVTIEKDFSTVTFDVCGLEFDRRAVLSAIGAGVERDA